MSDYIYGSSLRAAKSKVNYLFEGDFRRKPAQSLGGASRGMGRVELLQQAAEQRQNREDTRRRVQASVKIQSTWRGYRCRKKYAIEMRKSFDKLLGKLKLRNHKNMTVDEFDALSCEFIIYYNSKVDETRFDSLVDVMMKYRDVVLNSKTRQPKLWLHKITKLLEMNLKLLERHCSDNKTTMYLNFLELYTRPIEVLDNLESLHVWLQMIDREIFVLLRQLADTGDKTTQDHSKQLASSPRNLITELLRRSLNIQPSSSIIKVETAPSYAFFKQFFRSPMNSIIDTYYFTELIKMEPKQLSARNILDAFVNATSNVNLTRSGANTVLGPNEIRECEDAVWLCYSFVRTIYSQIGSMSDLEKIDYINVLSKLIAPAEYLLNVALIEAATSEDQYDESLEESSGSRMLRTKTDTQIVITKLIDLINQVPHINSLKSIIFSNDLQSRVQVAIVQLCNLMLANEHLAIFNCRLLYTVAFSREFSRHLWKSIVTVSTTSLFGTNTTIYSQISRGSNLSQESWRSILPKLKLFCSICSYLLPTIDDEEFYDDKAQSMLVETQDSQSASDLSTNNRNNSSNNPFFVGRELVKISAILRDMCVGFIEILYQGNRYSYQTSRSESNLQVEASRSLSFELKICFKALVRLVCQLHARDSRKQFCPDGHWICPSVVIPANKAIDFQLVTSQQGRLLNLMTKEDKVSERMANVSSEIKTVLILQEIPFVISFHDRVQIFHQLLRKERQIHQSEGFHFGLPGTAIQVQIRRNYLYEDAFEKLSIENEPNMKLPLKVALINAVGADEAGIDGGGLSKEFLGELLKTGFDPMRGFFKYTRDNLLYPNPSANVLFSTLPEGYEIHYVFLGRMLGKAIFEKIMVELPLATFFLAKLLALKHSSDVDIHNLESLDPVLYKNLVYLKNYKGDVADLNLDFTISNNELGEHEMVELKPNGSKIPVTRENKIEYVHLVADYRLNKQIRAQCAAFKRGLAQLIDLDWLRMFDPKELQILISGAPTLIDVLDWRRHTIYGNGYSDNCKVIKTFWDVVSHFDENQKRKLLKFATSCSLPPLLGFKDLVPPFAIAPSEEARLPTASTCMNLLKLPEIEDENTMRLKLLYAIESNSGFELS